MTGLEEHKRGDQSPAGGISHQLGQCMKLLGDSKPNTFLINHSFSVLSDLLEMPDDSTRQELMLTARTIVNDELGLEDEIFERIEKVASTADEK